LNREKRNSRKKKEQSETRSPPGSKLVDLMSGDATFADMATIPEIDISVGLALVAQNKNKMNANLDVFDSRLQQLHDMAEIIGTELDEQNAIAESIDSKAKKEIERLKAVNMKVNKAIQEGNSMLRLVFVIILLIVLAVCAGIVFVVIAVYAQGAK
jgi:hypothetical protein